MSSKYDALKLENQLCFPLYVVSKEVVKQYKPFLQALDMTYTQYIAMMAMWQCKELTVKKLGEYLYLDSGTLTPLLKTMEKKGWVERKRSQQDERVLNVMITPAGEALKEKAVAVPKQMSQCMKLEPEEAALLYKILHKMMTAL